MRGRQQHGRKLVITFLTMLLFQLQGRSDPTQTNAAATNAIRNDDDLLRFIQNATGNEYAKVFAGPKIVQMNDDLLNKMSNIKKRMKALRTPRRDGPLTIQEADNFLRENLSMAHLPTKCVEYEDVFYFSGGTSAKPIEDFSSGFAVRKGDPKIYTWSASEKTGVDEEK